MQEGTRVRVVKPIDNYPVVLVPVGDEGTLTRIDEEGCWWVKLDNHYPNLDEWDNEVAIWDWSEQDGPRGHPSTHLEAI